MSAFDYASQKLGSAVHTLDTDETGLVAVFDDEAMYRLLREPTGHEPLDGLLTRIRIAIVGSGIYEACTVVRLQRGVTHLSAEEHDQVCAWLRAGSSLADVVVEQQG